MCSAMLQPAQKSAFPSLMFINSLSLVAKKQVKQSIFCEPFFFFFISLSSELPQIMQQNNRDGIKISPQGETKNKREVTFSLEIDLNCPVHASQLR